MTDKQLLARITADPQVIAGKHAARPVGRLMRFLVDECTDPGVAAWFRQQRYEVFSVYEQARGSDDDTLIQKAFSENWVLITNDKDFGEMVYLSRRSNMRCTDASRPPRTSVRVIIC